MKKKILLYSCILVTLVTVLVPSYFNAQEIKRNNLSDSNLIYSVGSEVHLLNIFNKQTKLLGNWSGKYDYQIESKYLDNKFGGTHYFSKPDMNHIRDIDSMYYYRGLGNPYVKSEVLSLYINDLTNDYALRLDSMNSISPKEIINPSAHYLIL